MLIKYCKKLFDSAKEKYFTLSRNPSQYNCSMWCGWLGALLVYVLLFMSVASWWFLLAAPLLTVLFFIVFGHVGSYLSSKPPLSSETQKSCWCGALLITLAVSLIFIANILLFGVIVSTDTIWQWEQVERGEFSDWHPVIHTFSLYIFAQIWESKIFVTGCFVVIFSIICAWLYVSLRRYSVSTRTATILTLVIALFPLNFYALRVLWKDSAFMITLLAIGVAMMHLYFTRGAWLERWYNQILLAFLLVYASFVRHNGIFFTVFFILLLPLVAECWKIRIKLILFSVTVFLLCGGYIFCRMEMEKHNIIVPKDKNQSFHESVGVPMSILTHIFVNTPEKLPAEAVEFMSSVMPWEKWKEYYKGSFNSVKFKAPSSLMGDITPKEFFNLFFATLKAVPGTSVKVFLQVTSLGWEPWWRYKRLLRFTPFGLLASPGFYVMVLLLLTLLLVPYDGVRVFFMSLPFAAYSYGTALLLMGNDHRFFWGIIIGSMPVIITLFIALRHGRKEKIPTSGSK